MRHPVRGAGKRGEGRGFKTPIRRRVKLRYIRDAPRERASLIPLRCPLAHRRGIAIPGPFGSANRAASSKPARFFRRWRRFAAFLFPTKPASLGFCGGPYRLRRKEKALFDGVKRKRLGRRHSGLRPERSRRLLREFWPGGGRWLGSFNRVWRFRQLGPARMLCPSLFAAAPWWLLRAW